MKTVYKYIEQGHKILDRNKWEEWEAIVPIRVGDIYQGLELKHALKLIEMLDRNHCSFKVTQKELIKQNHSEMSFTLMLSLLNKFCSRGKEFISYIGEGV